VIKERESGSRPIQGVEEGGSRVFDEVFVCAITWPTSSFNRQQQKVKTAAAAAAAAAAADTLVAPEEFRIMSRHENSLAVDAVGVAR